MNFEKKERVGEYEFEEVLEKSSFGCVYKAYKTDMISRRKTYCAIKKISKYEIYSKELEEYLNNEIKSLLLCYSTKGPTNIIKLLIDDDIISNDDNFYLIMELCNGITLKKYLKIFKDNKVEIKFNIKRQIIYEIAKGIKQFTDKSIMHRNLKTDNIMLHFFKGSINNMTGIETFIELDNNFTIKIIDFGVSKIVKQGETAQTIVGTLEYMDPKILKARFEYSDIPLKYGSEIDIWSFGIICFEVLFGDLPFPKINNKDILKSYNTGIYDIPVNISIEEANFISSILQIDKRPNIDQILEHSFLNQYEPLTPINIEYINPSIIIKTELGESRLSLSMMTNTEILNPKTQKKSTKFPNEVINIRD